MVCPFTVHTKTPATLGSNSHGPAVPSAWPFCPGQPLQLATSWLKCPIPETFTQENCFYEIKTQWEKWHSPQAKSSWPFRGHAHLSAHYILEDHWWRYSIGHSSGDYKMNWVVWINNFPNKGEGLRPGLDGRMALTNTKMGSCFQGFLTPRPHDSWHKRSSLTAPITK